LTSKAKIYVKTSEVISELRKLPRVKIDYITFSGRGEPSLAKNLGQAIKAVKKLGIAPIAVLTNASLIGQAGIRKNLSYADFVVAKLDAYSQKSLERINQPEKAIKFDKIFQGIRQFRKDFKGKFALQIMFVKDNQKDAQELAKLAKEINPDEVQINTPLRPSKTGPLSRREISRIKKYFRGLNFVSVYDIQGKKVIPLSKKQALRRRGKLI